MKLEKKLEIFTNITMREVEGKRRQILREINEAFSKAVDEAVRAAQKSAKDQIREERYRIEKQKNKQIVVSSAEAKRKLIDLREKRTDDLFKDVERDVRGFIDSPDYDPYLLNAAQTAVSAVPGRYAFIRINPRDMRLAEKLAALTGLTVESDDEDFLGGFRLVSENRKAVADYTLLTRLREERRDFSMMASRVEAVNIDA